MDSILYRKAKVEDKLVLNNLFQKLLEYEKEFYDDNIKDDLSILSFFDNKINDDNHIIFVALDKDLIVGYIHCYIDYDNKIKKENEAEISSLYVVDEYRNKKISTKLINKLIEDLKNNDIKIVNVANFINNKYAKLLYEKLEFNVVQEKRQLRI